MPNHVATLAQALSQSNPNQVIKPPVTAGNDFLAQAATRAAGPAITGSTRAVGLAPSTTVAFKPQNTVVQPGAPNPPNPGGPAPPPTEPSFWSGKGPGGSFWNTYIQPVGDFLFGPPDKNVPSWGQQPPTNPPVGPDGQTIGGEGGGGPKEPTGFGGRTF